MKKTAPPDDPEPLRRRDPTRGDTARSLAKVVFVVLLFRAFVAEAFYIPSGSMEPTLLDGDRIFVNKFVYGLRIPFTATRLIEGRQPRRGEVAVFMHPKEPGTDLIKRVVGLGGDTVEIRDNRVYVNGKPLPRELLSTPYSFNATAGDVEQQEHLEVPCWMFRERLGEIQHPILHAKDAPPGNFGPFTVPRGHLFVMGDSRDNSSDSRYWGTVPLTQLKGKALFIWWSSSPRDGIRLSRLFRSIHPG